MNAFRLTPFNRMFRSAFPALPMLLALLAGGRTSAQVSVTATLGTTGPTPYVTLGDAFTAINAGTHQGDITIGITGDTTEPVPAALNASGSGAALYNRVNIQPVGGPRVISGNVVGAVIKLNGADNVTIDGRIAGVGRNLTVANTSAATATAAIWLSSTGVGAGATGNILRNLEIACGATQSTLTVNTFGIFMGGATIAVATGGDDNDNNSFIANRIIRVRYGIVTRGQAANNNLNPVVTDNIIGPAAFGADEIGKTAILMQGDTGALVSRNTIQFVGSCLLSQTCTTGADRVGIGIDSEAWSTTAGAGITAGDYTVTKNIIHDIVEERTFSAVGILAATTRAGVATNNLIANNFIYNIRANATSGDQVVGIGVSGGHTDRIIHNSIAITGDMDPGAAAAASTYGNAIRLAAASSVAHANLTLADNSIFMDVNSNTATLPYFAITVNSAAYSFGTGQMNNNNLFVNLATLQMNTGGLTASSTAPAGATLFNTLAQWKTALTVPQDAASIQLDPLYTSNTSDLHIPGSSPDVGAALNLGLADDIDGQPRDAAPDIGADEYIPLPGTLQLSSASYGGNEGTLLNVTVLRVLGSTGIVGVDITLADAGAVGGAACGVGVDYINPGTQVLSLGDGVTSRSIGVQLCTDLIADPGEGFTITLSNLTGGALPGAPLTATAAITDVPPPFSGAITVGSGQLYTSLTNPGGIFQALSLAGATSNVTINIGSDLAGETGTYELGPVAGGFTVLIKPSGAPRLVTGSNAGGLIRIIGADNVTLDGSTTGATAGGAVGGNAAIRELTIQNTSPSTTAAVLAVGNGADGAQNNTLKNLNILGQDPTTTLIGISLGGNAPGTAGVDNDGNRVENCSVRRAIFGIYSAGQNAANPNAGTVIRANDLSGLATERIRRVGILIFNDNGGQITLNSVGGIDTIENADAIGIGVGTQAIDATSVVSGAITNAVIANNRIDGVNGLSPTGFSAVGIAVAGGTGGANSVVNNMVGGVLSFATSPDLTAGIYVVGAAGSATRLYHNTVSLAGSRGTVINQFPGYGVAITGADPVVELKNNIFANVQDPGSGGASAKSYAIGMVTTTFANLDSDFNLFYSGGPLPGYFRSGSLNGAAGTDYATLVDWQTAVADDAASRFGDPQVVSASDLHLQICPANPAVGAGTPLAAVTTDIDGDARPATTPDIGADETAPLGIFSSAGGGGSISPAGNMLLSCGDNQSYAITPAPGYAILFVQVDGASVGSPAAYNFLNVVQSHTIAASFRGNLGSVPDRLSLGTPLTIAKNGVTPSHLNLSWGDSCGAAQTDFAIYEGVIGTWYSHIPLRCTTGGAFSALNLVPAAGSAYYLIVPTSSLAEGSYGLNSSGAEIPQGAGACQTFRDLTACN